MKICRSSNIMYMCMKIYLILFDICRGGGLVSHSWAGMLSTWQLLWPGQQQQTVAQHKYTNIGRYRQIWSEAGHWAMTSLVMWSQEKMRRTSSLVKVYSALLRPVYNQQSHTCGQKSELPSASEYRSDDLQEDSWSSSIQCPHLAPSHHARGLSQHAPLSLWHYR